MMVSKEEMVDVLETEAVSRFFFWPGLYLAIGVSSWANSLSEAHCSKRLAFAPRLFGQGGAVGDFPTCQRDTESGSCETYVQFLSCSSGVETQFFPSTMFTLWNERVRCRAT